MEAIILVISWTLFTPPAHDVDIRLMPDIESCLKTAKAITKTVSNLEDRGVQAKLVARCIPVPTHVSM